MINPMKLRMVDFGVAGWASPAFVFGIELEPICKFSEGFEARIHLGWKSVHFEVRFD